MTCFKLMSINDFMVILTYQCTLYIYIYINTHTHTYEGVSKSFRTESITK